MQRAMKVLSSPRLVLPTLLLAAVAMLLAGSAVAPRLGGAWLTVHTALEILAVAVAWTVFAVGWYGATGSQSRNAVLLSVAFLAVGLLDVGHLLSFPGMPALVS